MESSGQEPSTAPTAPQNTEYDQESQQDTTFLDNETSVDNLGQPSSEDFYVDAAENRSQETPSVDVEEQEFIDEPSDNIDESVVVEDATNDDTYGTQETVLDNHSETDKQDTTSPVNEPQAPTPISWSEAAKIHEEKLSQELYNQSTSFVDKAMLDQVEVNAKQSAANLVVLVHHLRTQLQNISSLSVQYMNIHNKAMEGVVQEVDEGIKSMREMISKCKLLNVELRKAASVHQEIKNTKKLLSLLEKSVDKVVR